MMLSAFTLTFMVYLFKSVQSIFNIYNVKNYDFCTIMENTGGKNNPGQESNNLAAIRSKSTPAKNNRNNKNMKISNCIC